MFGKRKRELEEAECKIAQLSAACDGLRRDAEQLRADNNALREENGKLKKETKSAKREVYRMKKAAENWLSYDGTEQEDITDGD